MYQPFLDVARAAAAEAASIIRRYYGRPLRVETKADASPVTIADRECERAIRATIAAAFPDHAFYGEETGFAGNRNAEFRWLVDPIDGTKSFVRGYPFFSTQIALVHAGRTVVGVSSAPVFGEEAWATLGGGAFLDGEPLRVSGTDRIEAAVLSAGNIASLASRPEAWSRYGELLQQVNRVRGYGDFYHYHLLARGAIDIVIESDLNILDVAALSLIVKESGGRFTTLSGGAIHDDMRTVMATNGRLHDETLRRVGWKD